MSLLEKFKNLSSTNKILVVIIIIIALGGLGTGACYGVHAALRCNNSTPKSLVKPANQQLGGPGPDGLQEPKANFGQGLNLQPSQNQNIPMPTQTPRVSQNLDSDEKTIETQPADKNVVPPHTFQEFYRGDLVGDSDSIKSD